MLEARSKEGTSVVNPSASSSSRLGNGKSRLFHSICKDSTEHPDLDGVNCVRPAARSRNISQSKLQSEKHKTLMFRMLGNRMLSRPMDALSKRNDFAEKFGPLIENPTFDVKDGLLPRSCEGSGDFETASLTFLSRKAGWTAALTSKQSCRKSAPRHPVDSNSAGSSLGMSR